MVEGGYRLVCREHLWVLKEEPTSEPLGNNSRSRNNFHEIWFAQEVVRQDQRILPEDGRGEACSAEATVAGSARVDTMDETKAAEETAKQPEIGNEES